MDSSSFRGINSDLTRLGEAVVSACGPLAPASPKLPPQFQHPPPTSQQQQQLAVHFQHSLHQDKVNLGG